MRLALLLTVGLALGVTTTASTAADHVDLGPVADTFVESGTQATWDHGLADHLDVDSAPTAVAYLKFDLTALPGPVRRATLTLFCRDGAPDGGTVYPVPDATWREGTHHGATSASANGPGLKWTDLDTNGDGTLDAADASLSLPDFTQPVAALGNVVAGQPVTVDVTAAFQAGPGLYALAIASGSTDEASYASRESTVASQRPVLHLELGTVAPPPTTTTTPASPPPTATTTTTPAPASPTTTLPPPPPTASHGRFHARPMVLAAASGPLKGEGENLTCFHKQGPKHGSMEVGRIHISMPGDGGHHVILFRPHPGPVQWPPKNCPLTLNWDQWELIAQTQHPELDWKLPPGVAINISRKQPLLIQTHYVKGSHPKTRHAMTKTKLYPMDPATVTAHAGALFLNDRSMVVPPHTRMTEVSRCTVTGEGGQAREVKLLGITGHYHFRGQGFEAYRVHTDGSLGELLYRYQGFDQPNFQQFSDPPVLHPGEGIEWRCHYQNNTDKTFTYGPDASTQEHCILFGAYYPTSTVQEGINCTQDKDANGHLVSTVAIVAGE
jgi:Copper type II ascorbate-dependent monooxygenase, C-terminal domain